MYGNIQVRTTVAFDRTVSAMQGPAVILSADPLTDSSTSLVSPSLRASDALVLQDSDDDPAVLRLPLHRGIGRDLAASSHSTGS